MQWRAPYDLIKIAALWEMLEFDQEGFHFDSFTPGVGGSLSIWDFAALLMRQNEA